MLSLLIIFFFLLTSPSLSVSPGINVINNPASAGYVPSDYLKKWVVYAPNSPIESANYPKTASNIVFRIHSAWTTTGLKMLGSNAEQQQVAQEWCDNINPIAAQNNVYIEPFNELEQDYERKNSTSQTLDLTTAIAKAKTFISYLSACSQAKIISPALDPQSANFPTTSAAFSNFDIISCHPYRTDTLNTCLSLGKPLLLTEIGVDKNGVKYDDCEFINLFCSEKFTDTIQRNTQIIAYFLFTFSPGNYAGAFWEFKDQDVAYALQNQCNGLSIETCDTSDKHVAQIVRNLINRQPLPATQPDLQRGINTGPLTTTDNGAIDWILNTLGLSRWWVYLYLKPNANKFPFHLADTTDQYSGEETLSSVGYIPQDSYKQLIQPSAEVIDRIRTVRNTNKIEILGLQDNYPNGYSNQVYRQARNDLGSGYLFSLNSQPYNFIKTEEKKILMREYLNFKSGVSSRLPYNTFTEDDMNDYLCSLAAAGDPANSYYNTFSDIPKPLDHVLGYMNPTLEHNYSFTLSNGIGTVDRSKTDLGNKPIEIKSSTFFCTNTSLDAFLAKCSQKYGAISPSVCRNTPDYLKQTEMEGVLYQLFWPRLRYLLSYMRTNNPTKVFLERCQVQDKFTCTIGNAFAKKIITSSNFLGLSNTQRDTVLLEDSGSYLRVSADTCLSCKVAVIYMPNLTSADNATSTANDNLTPWSSHSTKPNLSSGRTYGDVFKKTAVYNDDSRAHLATTNNCNDPSNSASCDFNLEVFSRTEKPRTFLPRFWDLKDPCIASTQTDDSGNTKYSSACDYEFRTPFYTTLYVPNTFDNFFTNQKNYYSYYTPYKSNQAIKTEIQTQTNSPSGELTSVMTNSPISGNQMSGLADPQNMTPAQDSGYQTISESANTQYVGNDPEVYRQVNRSWMLPYKWQN